MTQMSPRATFVPMDRDWPRPSRRQWALVAFSCAMAAAGGALSLHEREALAQAQAHMQRASARLSPIAAPTSVATAAQVEDINQAIRLLNVPTVALMSALTAPASMPVALDSVEFKLDAGKGDGHVALVAEAPDAATMIEYLDLLATRRPLKDVELVKHQLIPPAAGMAIRFEADARWREEAR